jgi:hypothetical protein
MGGAAMLNRASEQNTFMGGILLFSKRGGHRNLGDPV